MENEIKAVLAEQERKVQSLITQATKGVITKREYLEKQLDYLAEAEHAIYCIVSFHMNP